MYYLFSFFEQEETKMKLYNKLYFQGHLWTIIGLEKTHMVSIATLLLDSTSTCGGKMAFDDKSSGRYYGSSTEKYLHELKISDGFKPLVTDLDDEGCQAYWYLLSVEEAKKLPQNILKFNGSWWLRTLGNKYGFQSYVNADGNIRNDANKVYDKYIIRPAMKVRTADLISKGGIIIPSFDITDQDWSIE